ncbi:MAG: energy transducer TonB [Candidatus Aminicenantales bacterium]
MKTRKKGERAFQTAVFISIFAHLVLFTLLLVSPSLPEPSRKKTIHYVNLISFPHARGGRRGEEAVLPPGRETLKDLTTAQKLKDQTPSSLRHPVEKPKKDDSLAENKKAAISKSERTLEEKGSGRSGQRESTSKTSASTGTGLRIGGLGEEASIDEDYTSRIGFSRFPYTYYLQAIMDRVSSNWFTSLVEPGISGTFKAVVYFKITRNGQVMDLRIDRSSGIRSLDLSALRAIRSSSPFPPLPEDYGDEYLVIRLIFEHSK